MHKIKKGIKKKIIGKKSKHDGELFTEEELEQYKREKAAEAQRLAQQNQTTENPLDEHLEENNEENYHEYSSDVNTEEQPATSDKSDWKSFLATTDTVLKKTTDNLEHIKESSYFQGHKLEKEDHIVPSDHEFVETASQRQSACTSPVVAAQTKSWVDLDKEGIDDEQSEEEATNHVEIPEPSQPKKKLLELKPIEDFPEVSAEDYADVFDTAYVDDIEKGELNLIIPDSPVDEYANEPDPFDTSVADKVLHIEEPEPEPQVILGTKQKVDAPKKRKIQLVSLGNAVDVLTGKAPAKAKTVETEEVSLLGEFTENTPDKEVLPQENKEDEETEESQINDSAPECKTTDFDPLAEENSPTAEKSNLLDDILFGIEEPIDDLPENISIVQVVKSETGKLNEESEEITNKLDISEFLPENDESLIRENETEKDFDDIVNEFDILDKDKVKPSNSNLDNILVKPADDVILDEFDAEFASIAHESVTKAKNKALEDFGIDDDDDPFDTSHVTEVIESSDVTDQTANGDSTDKEGPNKLPTRPAPPRPCTPSKPDLLSSENIIEESDPFDTSNIQSVISVDHLQSTENDADLADTLEPVLPKSSLSRSESFDPFDTSAADAFGITELKVLESQLLSENSAKIGELKSSDSDFDFNPRADEEPPVTTCLLSEADNVTIDNESVLSPQQPKEDDDFDPFDTSIAEKIQIKSLEEELIEKIAPVEIKKLDKPKQPPPRPKSPACLLVTSPITEDINPALQPQTHSSENTEDQEDFDPFDTSIADAYGKTELKVLETELLASSPAVSYKEEIVLEQESHTLKLDVKPPPRPPSPACLLAATPIDENPTLVPQAQLERSPTGSDDIDPFDTSIAQQFGKTELHVLESQLLEQRPESQLSNCSDFDPRAHSPNIPAHKIEKSVDTCLLNETPDIGVPIIQPQESNTDNYTEEPEELDPFDTSIADKLGTTELKHLESELLCEKEKTTTPPEISEQKTDTPLNIDNSSLSFPLQSQQCLLATTPTDTNKPLQPFTKELGPTEASEAEDLDPFDTSIANQFGRTEIKELEETLLSAASEPIKPVYHPKIKQVYLDETIDPFDTSVAENHNSIANNSFKRSLSDDEFDPRQEESKRLSQQVHLLDSAEGETPIEPVTLQPQQTSETKGITEGKEEEEVDPFDTSIAASILPGKTELKLLESELLK